MRPTKSSPKLEKKNQYNSEIKLKKNQENNKTSKQSN
jgi:hypothetical protein